MDHRSALLFPNGRAGEAAGTLKLPNRCTRTTAPEPLASSGGNAIARIPALFTTGMILVRNCPGPLHDALGAAPFRHLLSVLTTAWAPPAAVGISADN